ncbi:uncharacterized protein BDR25DRAFT_61243 [Lindgomyces ingoldianus]|uniref:Uncharacterized protein n=1 Tax=Lindgomyces ingoldianus TaxID=673940 RepID=A0ACB6QMR9_9PLEO|nr:uncharacterized protein BDR25DRAFT_61243 [Lindgomyces ingoldianus]KAF2467607.1 hypothetical protein BDR25DRAFT_61243 [Lindgomyces ingoldianus]
MTKFTILAAIFAAVLAKSSATDFNPPKECPCYTATAYETNNGCPAFSKPCIVPMCMLLSTSTIPGPNTACKKTPTVTSYLPCQTACQKGCATHTTTETASTSCLALTTPPPPSSLKSCYTKTVTASKKCPAEDALNCIVPDCIMLLTTTVPGPAKECTATPTVTVTRTCKSSCEGGCATQWVTATATPWEA